MATRAARWKDRLSTALIAAPWRELAGLAGACAILYGLAQWSEPGAWIVGGCLTLLVATRA